MHPPPHQKRKHNQRVAVLFTAVIAALGGSTRPLCRQPRRIVPKRSTSPLDWDLGLTNHFVETLGTGSDPGLERPDQAGHPSRRLCTVPLGR